MTRRKVSHSACESASLQDSTFPEEHRASLLLEEGKDSLAEILTYVTISLVLEQHTSGDPNLELITKAELNQHNLQKVKEIISYIPPTKQLKYQVAMGNQQNQISISYCLK